MVLFIQGQMVKMAKMKLWRCVSSNGQGQLTKVKIVKVKIVKVRWSRWSRLDGQGGQGQMVR